MESEIIKNVLNDHLAYTKQMYHETSIVKVDGKEGLVVFDVHMIHFEKVVVLAFWELYGVDGKPFEKESKIVADQAITDSILMPRVVTKSQELHEKVKAYLANN